MTRTLAQRRTALEVALAGVLLIGTPGCGRRAEGSGCKAIDYVAPTLFAALQDGQG